MSGIRTSPLGQRWRPLDGLWPRIEAAGRERSTDKDSRPSTNAWAKDGAQHLYGVAGEAAFADYMGLAMDWTLLPKGDGGVVDFPLGGGVQVKAVPWRGEFFDYHLKEDPELRAKGWPEFYVLVAVDLAARRARMLGWTGAAEVQQGRRIDYGYGDRLVVRAADLHGMDFFPPLLESLFNISTSPHLPGRTT